MKFIGLFIVLLFSFTACKSSKQHIEKVSNSKEVIKSESLQKDMSKIDSTANSFVSNEAIKTEPIFESKARSIADYALQFEGVKYKWGGTTKSGMDCSGLVFESFKAHNIILPRISRDMAKIGEKITLKKVQEGDLLFFKTRNRRNDINHVGLVIDTNSDIKFIHATSSSGVIISKLSENYWEKAYVEVRRIL